MENKSNLKKLSKTKVKKAKVLISKMNLSSNIKSTNPIFDEVYFKGLKFLSKN